MLIEKIMDPAGAGVIDVPADIANATSFHVKSTVP